MPRNTAFWAIAILALLMIVGTVSFRVGYHWGATYGRQGRAAT
jgi:hypothetical protein